MLSLIERILEYAPDSLLVTDAEIRILLGEATADKRYALVKRALAKGNLLRVKRGLYLLHERFRKRPLNLFELADRIYGPSCISFESALAHHGWIPEAVYTVTSACSKRNRTFSTPVGVFTYTKVPDSVAFHGVVRHTEVGELFLLASPWRALLDLVSVSRKRWTGSEQLIADLRIEREHLRIDSAENLQSLAAAYRQAHVERLARVLIEELS